MDEYAVPGMAIGVIYAGQRYEYYYGVRSKETHEHVKSQTIFELGSFSKTFTALAGTYAQNQAKLAFSDRPSKYIPTLKNSEIDQVNLLALLSYTSGHLPLQFPEKIKID